MKLFWTEPDLQDLQNLRDYIANDSDIHAANFISSILMRVDRLEQLPLIGRIVPEAQSNDIREIIYRTYRIIYRVTENHIDILAVIHGSRDLWEKQSKPWDDA